MPEPTRDMRFQAVLPTLQKSVVYQPDGSFYIGGICSDPSLDLQGDRVDQASVLAHADYLKSWGKLNWNHQAEAIGDIEEVRRITPKEAAREFGRKLEGDGTYMKARVYPLVAPVNGVDVNPTDLKRAHQRAHADAHMGFSLQGKLRRIGGVAYPTAIYQTALCDQAINTNTVAVPMAKSLQEAQELWEAGQPDVVIEYGEVRLAKAEFADPFPDRIPGEQLSPAGVDRGLRLCLASEEEACSMYTAQAAAADLAGVPEAAEVLRSIADEERVHAGEFLRLLDTLNGSEASKLAEGAAEVEDMLSTRTKGLLAMAKAHVKGHVRTVGGKLVQVKEHEDKRTTGREGTESAAVIRHYADKVRTDSQGPTKYDYQGKAGVARLNRMTSLLDLYAELLAAEGPGALSSRAEQIRATAEHAKGADLTKLTDELRTLHTCEGLLKRAGLAKSLSTNADTDEATLTGGASFRKQSLKPRLCSKCGAECGDDETMCKCGAKQPSLLAKGLAALAGLRVQGGGK